MRPPPAGLLVLRSVNAAGIEHFDPEANHSITAAKLRRHDAARQSHEKGADDRQPNVTAPIGRGLHRHSQFLQRGVLCIRLGLLMAQPPPYRKSFAIVQALFRNFILRTALLGVVKSFNPTLCELPVSDILIRFCERIPYAFVILWAIDHAGVSAQQFGILTAIEMATAMICYIPVAYLADKYGQRPFVLATFVFFTLFPVSLLWADSFGWLALAFVVRGLKEFGEPARKAFIIAHASPELRGRTYGAYYLIRDSVVTSGSFVGAALWSISPQANFIGAALIGLIGTLWFRWFISRRSADSLPSVASSM